MINAEKVFYNPGDIVRVRHNIDCRPKMYVMEKVTRSFKKEGSAETVFVGIKCRWFDANFSLCEATFSTKDLEHIIE